MGQQELLLTILVTVIVGISVIVAVNTMQKAHTESNRNAIRQDMLMILNDAQTYYHKPTIMGGGSYSFDSISKSNILSVDQNNENGTYKISGSGNTVTVEGTGPHNEITLLATATMQGSEMEITWSDPEE